MFSRVPGTCGVPSADDTAFEEGEGFRNSSLCQTCDSGALFRTGLSTWVYRQTDVRYYGAGYQDNATSRNVAIEFANDLAKKNCIDTYSRPSRPLADIAVSLLCDRQMRA